LAAVRSFRTPAHNIVVVCSGSHEKKVNLGEVFSFGEVFSCSGSHEKKVNLGEVFCFLFCSGFHEKKVNLGEVFVGEVFVG
jgi:hypothetical protein